MNNCKKPRSRLQKGASLVEYALLGALIAVVCVAGMAAMGEKTSRLFSNVGSGLPD